MWPQERLSPGEMYERGAGMTAVLESAAQSFVEHPSYGTGWHRVCAVEDLEPAWGEAALIAGRQVALFRTVSGEVYAVGQEDPATGAYVMARGITGSRGSCPTVASPLHKEVYDLRTGECLGTPELRLPTFGTRIVGGYIEVEL
ncbi:nitrite reductase (NADH) small subunit [Pseudarthrobacter sp. PvP090]